MSSERNAAASPLTFGTAGTAAYQAAIGTSTTNPIQLPREDYTLQVTVSTTGTSGVGATVIMQVSNDNVGWLAITSATATATQAATTTSVSAAGVSVSSSRYAYGRAILGITGTGSASAILGH